MNARQAAINAPLLFKKLRTALFLLGWHFASYWLLHITGVGHK
jgi:hypothetical protein